MVEPVSFEHLVQQIGVKSKNTEFFVIAISGFGGSGKSTTARKLAEALKDAISIPLDDFIVNRFQGRSSEWASFDWQRLIKEVLLPIRKGEKSIEYGVYSWIEDNVAQKKIVEIKKYVIIEGVGLIRDSLQEYFDCTVWIDTPFDIAIARGKKRDKEEYGADHDKLWDEVWGPNDRDYFEKCKPKERADFVLSVE